MGGWVCEVWQSAYGHRAAKATWLYYHGDAAPVSLRWSARPARIRLGFLGPARGKGSNKPTLSKRRAAATPVEFRTNSSSARPRRPRLACCLTEDTMTDLTRSEPSGARRQQAAIADLPPELLAGMDKKPSPSLQPLEDIEQYRMQMAGISTAPPLATGRKATAFTRTTTP